MKRHILLSIIIMAAFSAFGKPNEFKQSSFHFTSQVFPEKGNFSGMEDTIHMYCKKGTLENFRLAKAVMDTCTHENTLAWLYNFVHDSLINAINEGIRKSHPDVIYSADDRPMATWSELDKFFPLLKVDLLCGECSVEAMANVAPFLALAAKTKGNCDDAYFGLLKLMYYEESMGDTVIYEGGGNINNWMTMDGCDFCSYSELGGGEIFKMYQQRDKVYSCGKLFKEKSKNYSSYFQPDDYENHFGYSKEEVIAEMNKILKSVQLTVEERKSLEKTLQKIKAGTGIQFNCKKGGCTYDMN